MPAADQEVWNRAVAFYRQHMVQRDLLFDDEMRQIDSYLAKMEGAPEISKDVIGSEVSAVLNSAAPVFREYWWQRHDAQNRFWIKLAQPLLTALAQQMRMQLSSAYEEEWPGKPVRVDMAVYANWAGAYTTTGADGQVHTIMASDDPGNQGFAALETLFHEASHALVGERTGKVAEAIQNQAKANGIPVPNQLWHALIFYTAGEFARRDLDRLGVHDYEPYAQKRGLWTGDWQDYQSLLAIFWRAHMDGKLSLDEAIAQIMKGLAATGSKKPAHP